MALHDISSKVGTSELSYVAFTSDVACTATTEATANTIVTADTIIFDGATTVLIEFFAVAWDHSSTTQDGIVSVFDNGSAIGRFFQNRAAATSTLQGMIHCVYRVTPSAASHAYSIRGWVSGASTFTVKGGAGGAGNFDPGFVRIIRA